MASRLNPINVLTQVMATTLSLVTLLFVSMNHVEKLKKINGWILSSTIKDIFHLPTFFRFLTEDALKPKEDEHDVQSYQCSWFLKIF